MNSYINKNDARKQGGLQKQPGRHFQGQENGGYMPAAPSQVSSKSCLSAWLQKVKLSLAGQIFKLVKSSSSKGNGLKKKLILYVTYYNCFYFVFFSVHIKYISLLAGSWMNSPTRLASLVGPTVTE